PAIPVPEPAEEQEDEPDQQARAGELRQERQVREQPRRRPRGPAGGQNVAVGVGAHEGDVRDHEAEECFRAGAPRLRPSPPESPLTLHAAPASHTGMGGDGATPGARTRRVKERPNHLRAKVALHATWWSAP